MEGVRCRAVTTDLSSRGRQRERQKKKDEKRYGADDYLPVPRFAASSKEEKGNGLSLDLTKTSPSRINEKLTFVSANQCHSE